MFHRISITNYNINQYIWQCYTYIYFVSVQEQRHERITIIVVTILSIICVSCIEILRSFNLCVTNTFVNVEVHSCEILFSTVTSDIPQSHYALNLRYVIV